jgi:CRP/FNR family cyclic AMP-dependent transcriptional regulator
VRAGPVEVPRVGGGRYGANVEIGLASAASLPRRFDDSTPVVRQGDRGRCLFLVTAGLVRLTSVLPSGRQVVLALVEPGEVFGESALLGEPSPFEARALAVATVAPIDVDTLEAIISRQPATAAEVLRLLASRLQRTSAALEDALALDVGARVSRRLHELAARYGVPERAGVRLGIAMTQEDLGRMVGASRESVNRSIRSLASRGLIHRRGRSVVIPDLDALARAGDSVS